MNLKLLKSSLSFDFKNELQIGNKSIIDGIGNVIFEINKANREDFTLSLLSDSGGELQIFPIEDRGKWRVFPKLEDGVFHAKNIIGVDGNLMESYFVIFEGRIAIISDLHQIQNVLFQNNKKEQQGELKLIFDFETNGSSKSSPLSFGAIIVDKDYNVLETIERFYHIDNHNEKFNRFAFNVHKLSSKAIDMRRQEASARYPKFFKDDKEIEYLFLNPSFTHYIGHNIISFDAKVIENKFGIQIDPNKIICTLKLSRQINKSFSSHKLSSLTSELNINTSCFEQYGESHNALYDCFCTLEVLKRLITSNNCLRLES